MYLEIIKTEVLYSIRNMRDFLPFSLLINRIWEGRYLDASTVLKSGVTSYTDTHPSVHHGQLCFTVLSYFGVGLLKTHGCYQELSQFILVVQLSMY